MIVYSGNNKYIYFRQYLLKNQGKLKMAHMDTAETNTYNTWPKNKGY